MPTVPELLAPQGGNATDTAPSRPAVLADQAAQTRDRMRDNFVSTLETVSTVNPDHYAKATEIEKLSGVPADILYKHRDQMNRMMQGNKYAGVYDQYRRTAEALSSGKAATLAQDDIDNLTRIEQAGQISRFNDQSAGEKIWGSIKQAFQGQDQGEAVSYADRLERLKGTFDGVDQEVTRAALANELPYGGKPQLTGFAADYLQLSPEDRAGMRDRLLGRQAGAITKATDIQAEMEGAPIEPGAIRNQELGGDTSAMATAIAQNPGYAFRTAVGSAATMGPMLVAGAIGGPLAAGAVEFGTESDAKLVDVLREAKVDLGNPKAILTALQDDALMTDARRRAALKAAGTTAVDVIGMGLAGKLLVPSKIGGKALTTTQKELGNIAAQLPVQAVTGGLSEAVGQYAADGKVNGGDVLMEAVAGVVSTPLDIATFGGGRIIESIGQGLEQSRKARESKATIDEMVDASLNSKTRGRDAETFAGVAENQLKGSDFETISIPAQTLNSLNQDGAPPVLGDLMKNVPGMTEQFAEAEARGGSVTMKTSDYLAYFAEYHEQLSGSIRTQVDGMSVDESKVWQEAQEEQIATLQESLKQPPSAYDDAFVGLMSELQGAGYRRADAEQYASVHLSALGTLANRTGKALPELMARFPLDIRNKAPETLQSIPVDDMRIAIGRLRSGDIPQSKDMFGKSLVEYLRDAGGVNDAGGELSALDVNVGKVGRNRLAKTDGGMSLDDAAMRAWENGYFPGVPREEVGPQLIVDAVQRDMNDQPTFSSENENATLRDQAANLQNLQDYLDQLGVDMNELSDDQVLAILRDPESVEGVQLDQTGNEKQPRGFITFNNAKKGEQRKFQITVTGRRDLSTLLHEFGHFYLEVVNDLASDADAPQQIKDDIAAIRAWTGAKESGAFEVAQHEQFARGFERYLAEGKAPNPELAGAFARFKRWIIAVYKDLRRLDVELTPEIRGVMDRIVATDEQIRAAEQVAQAIPMFETAEKAGMTETEFQAYRNQIELAHDEAATTIEQQIIREEERRNSKWWAEQSAKVAIEVDEELQTIPEYAAIRALRTGVMPDGTQQKIKLNSAQIKEQYGTAVLRKLAFMHEKGGMDMDVAAVVLNFTSGDELVKGILGAPSRAETIKAETQIRMEERYGPRSNGEAAERAMDAVHNEKRGAVLLKELHALGKQGNRNNITSQQVLKMAAERIMQERKVRDIQPFEYQRAEATAGRRAFDAAAKGDLAAAYQAKQQQLLNFYLWREALKARQSVDAIVDRMAKNNKSSVRERLGKAGHDYLDQVDAVMEQYEFRNVSLRDIDKRVSFATWYTDQMKLGNEPDVPEFMWEASQRVNYKELSLAQLQELDGFVQNVKHLAGLKNKLMANSRLRDFKEATDLMSASAYGNLEKRKPLPLDPSTMSAAANFGQGFGNMSSSLLKMEQIIEWLDGGDVDGPWHNAFWQPFVEAQAQENDINRELTTRLMANIEAHQAANGRKALREQQYIKSINQTFSKNAILAVALNVGNAGNRSKLLKGHAWEEHQLAEILGYMNKADWDFVQGQWDLVESLWPQIEQLERDLHGVPPDKVQATPVQTPYGEVSGGYWPLVYDVTSGKYASVANTLADGTGLFEEGYGKATTPRGHTKARVDGFAAPLMLDTGIIANHLGQVVHDLTHRRPIMDAAKIIGNEGIKQTLIDTLGPNIANQFNPWLRGVANDRTMDSQKGLSWWSKALQQGSANLSIAWMGFSVTTGVQQILGFSQSMEHLAQTGGRRFLLRGAKEFATHPMDTMKWVKAVSGEMRNRDANLDNNIREALRKSAGKNGAHAVMQRLAFKHIALIQSVVDYPTWLAGYHQAIDAGESHDVAVRTGDRAVRLSQMAAGPKDLSAVQRNSFMKPFTIVYSYFNLLYNRQADLAHSMKTAKGVQDYLNAFERTMYLIVMPSMLAPLLVGNGPGEDDSWAEWMALKIATYPLMGVPFVRDAASALESGWAYSGATPVGEVFKSITRLAKAATQDEVDAEQITLATMDAIGLSVGVPTAQPKRVVKYLFGVADGTAPSDDIVDWTKGLMFGPPKESK